MTMRLLIRIYDSIRMYDAALYVLKDYIEQFPEAEDHLQKRVQVGLLYAKMNDYLRAVDELRSVKLTADPETETEIQYWIGDCFFNMGRYREAIFEFLKVEYLSKPTKLPWNTTALYKAAQAYMKIGEPEKAKTLYERVVEKEGAASDMGRIARERIREIESGMNST